MEEEGYGMATSHLGALSLSLSLSGESRHHVTQKKKPAIRTATGQT